MSELMSAPVADSIEVPKTSFREVFFVVAALLIIVIGGALRVYHLGHRSLWFDEALTANSSRTTLAHMMEAQRARGSAPVVHPYILYLVEKVGKSAVAVRMPSVLASLLAIFMMLAMVRAKVSQNAALFAAAILAVSASQIRYAQEVREYSLAVLFATVLIYCLLKWEATGSRNRQPFLLYGILFLVPLVQYGLVLLAAAVLSTVVLRLLLADDTRFRISHLIIGSASLAAGGLLSFFLTVRYQFHPGQGQWYLAANYFDPKTMSLFRYLGSNSKGLLSFFIPGQLVSLCFVLAAVIFCVAQARKRKFDPLTLLVFTSFAITFCASVFKLYPYGGIRQCLFLAPGLILFAGVVIAYLLQRIKGSWQPIVSVAFLALIFFSGYRGMLRVRPYGEYEDTLSILRELAKSSTSSDQVWVNHDAVEAVDFYLQGKDHRFVYGKYHKDPNDYIPELFASIDPHGNRIWLVFSHLQQRSDHYEEQLIVNSLRPSWDVQSVIAPMNTELFVAHRRTSP
ncbi:MAG: glycosyltransferase family 39 protein [Terriglobales bacterium]